MSYISSRLCQKYIKRNYCREIGGCLKSLPETHHSGCPLYSGEYTVTKRGTPEVKSEGSAAASVLITSTSESRAGAVLSNKSRQRRKFTHVHMLHPCKGQTD